MITSFALLHPETALATALSAHVLRPLFEKTVLRLLLVVYVINARLCSCQALCLQILIACRLYMIYVIYVIDSIALDTVLDTAGRTEVVRLILLFLEEKVVAAISRALHHARVLIADLFPLKLLAARHLLRRE